MAPGAWVATGLVAAALSIAVVGVSLALLTSTFANGANTFNTDTMAAPTSPSATGGSPNIILNWTATATTYAAGTNVLRATVSGGPYSQIAQVTPRTTATYTDTPGAGTYYYVLRSYYQSWESANSSQVFAATTSQTGYLDCSANAAVTTSSGDNNGYETTPGNACANDASSASDASSGTGTSSSCTSTAKDRHLFYNYGLSIPAGAAISGIEVRTDAWASSTTNSPHLCVDLSWDGGTTWTAAKTAANLTTAETTIILGTSSDNWGRTWTDAEFSNANFRVRITDVAGSTARTFNLDWVAVQVTYSP
jgi:hypothetical protein